MISVVTAYYNRKKLFVRTLDSMKPYYDKIDFEVIVVDDGSEEQERLEDLQIEFPFLRIIRLEKESKWYKNPCIPFNIGFSQIRGDKVIIQNPECYHFDNILEYVDEKLQENDYLSFGCYSLDKLNTDEDKLFLDKKHIQNLIKENNKAFITDGDLGWYNHSVYRPESFHFCTALTAKDLFDIGGFDERYAKGIGYDDDDLIWRIKKKNMNIKFIDDRIVLHQNHYIKPHNIVEANKKRRESYKLNQRIFEDITQCNHPWKANFIENNYYNTKIENRIADNYFLEYNKLTKKVVEYKFSRKMGLYLLKVLSKIKF
ncbi:glycosyltransferase family 2 protein [Flavobacterium sediminilitoris]|uniref:Glycosyltransferase family 2 protein n=1 Tax=Flavobacterium sediminilitoris TaxID=2024526 RepID=A0ABY4HMX3_9FLAO|nr:MULTISPECIES: glycosyltransferase family 2 protein [Flavobacterium]UOX34030.1 glycosyltransferase family 2 protein [Flavobacterium sediminilitoris]